MRNTSHLLVYKYTQNKVQNFINNFFDGLSNIVKLKLDTTYEENPLIILNDKTPILFENICKSDCLIDNLISNSLDNHFTYLESNNEFIYNGYNKIIYPNFKKILYVMLEYVFSIYGLNIKIKNNRDSINFQLNDIKKYDEQIMLNTKWKILTINHMNNKNVYLSYNSVYTIYLCYDESNYKQLGLSIQQPTILLFLTNPLLYLESYINRFPLDHSENENCIEIKKLYEYINNIVIKKETIFLKYQLLRELFFNFCIDLVNIIINYYLLISI